MLKLNTAMLVMLFGLTISTTSVVASAAQNVTAEQAYAASAGKFYTEDGQEITWTYDESAGQYPYQLVVGTLTIKANRPGLTRIKNTPYFRKTDLNSNDFQFLYNGQLCEIPEIKQSVYFVSKAGLAGLGLNYFQIRADTCYINTLKSVEVEIYEPYSASGPDAMVGTKSETRLDRVYSVNAFSVGITIKSNTVTPEDLYKLLRFRVDADAWWTRDPEYGLVVK